MESVKRVSPLGANFHLSVRVPSSKSYCNRLLILAAQSAKPIVLQNVSDSTDVGHLIEALKVIGVTVTGDLEQMTVYGPFPACEKRSSEVVELHTGDGGTTNRFLLPLLAKGKNRYRLFTAEKLRERPHEPLFSGLSLLGASLRFPTAGERFWIEVMGQGRLAGRIDVDCSQSTQFASGLLLVSHDQPVQLNITGLSSSEDYLRMTKNLIEEIQSGVVCYTAPVDASSLSYPLALGAVAGSVQIENCHSVDYSQADSVLLQLFKEWGINFSFGPEGLMVQASVIPPFKHHCASCPDLAPTLAFLASFSSGGCELSGLQVLRHKESDRLAEICRLLKIFGVDYQLNEQQGILRIEGRVARQASFVSYIPPKDHRIIMVGYLFMACLSGGELHHCAHVAKSFPGFFEQFEAQSN